MGFLPFDDSSFGSRSETAIGNDSYLVLHHHNVSTFAPVSDGISRVSSAGSDRDNSPTGDESPDTDLSYLGSRSSSFDHFTVTCIDLDMMSAREY
jgi:hypothetical protein